MMLPLGILALSCFLTFVIGGQSTNVLDLLNPVSPKYVWEFFQKSSPEYNAALKIFSRGMSDGSPYNVWEFMDSKDSKTYQCFWEEELPGEAKTEKREQEFAPAPLELLAPLKSVCVYKNEGWWSYEFCHGKHVRQFHMDHIPPNEMRLGAEFYLGFATEVSEDVISESSWTFRANYEKGTKCDLTSERRTSVVNFVCDPKGDTHIESIVETTSCNYEVNVNTPLLCKHPKYKVSETEKDTKIFCLEIPLERSEKKTHQAAPLESETANTIAEYIREIGISDLDEIEQEIEITASTISNLNPDISLSVTADNEILLDIDSDEIAKLFADHQGITDVSTLKNILDSPLVGENDKAAIKQLLLEHGIDLDNLESEEDYPLPADLNLPDPEDLEDLF